MRGYDKSWTDLLVSADRWWAEFRSLTFRGRPKGTGTWTSREDFENELDRTLEELRSRGVKVTQEKVAGRLCITKKTLSRWLQDCGRNWSEIREN